MILYAKIAGAVLVLAGLIGIGWWLGSAHWKTQYEALQAADWKGEYQRQKDVATDLQKKLEDSQATAQRNSGVIGDLNEKLALTATDRERLVSQLRIALTAPERPSCNPVSAPSDKPRTPAAPEARSTGSASVLSQYIADAVIECRQNVLTGTALIEQLKPQLEK